MTSTISSFPLRDGPLAVAGCRADLVAAMAADLVTYDAFGNEADAIRSLYATRKYEMADIVMLIDDVRQAAMQAIVAREMSKP